MNNWKEELKKIKAPNELELTLYGYSKTLERLEDFISKEIIEKIINEIPDGFNMRLLRPEEKGSDTEVLKRQLKDKYLNQ